MISWYNKKIVFIGVYKIESDAGVQCEGIPCSKRNDYIIPSGLFPRELVNIYNALSEVYIKSCYVRTITRR